MRAQLANRSRGRRRIEYAIDCSNRIGDGTGHECVGHQSRAMAYCRFATTRRDKSMSLDAQWVPITVKAIRQRLEAVACHPRVDSCDWRGAPPHVERPAYFGRDLRSFSRFCAR